MAGHDGGAVQNFGVKGIEDSDWQNPAGDNAHNEYLGVPTDKHVPTFKLDTSGGSMSAFCCGCHGNFHNQNVNATTGAGSQSPWIRHPSDFVIPNTGEYASMNTSYNLDTPVARSLTKILTFGGTSSNTVTAGSDMVMCLSCHRPHGSEYEDLLRWEYAEMIAGGGSNTTGCFVCHTTKDD